MAHDKWTVTASSHSLWDLSMCPAGNVFIHQLRFQLGCVFQAQILAVAVEKFLLFVAQIRNKSQICCLIRLWMVKFLVGQVVKYFSCLSVSHCHRFMLVHCVLRAVAMSSWSQSIHTSILPSSPIICPLMKDRQEFTDAVRLIREIFAQKSSDLLHGKELQPGG